MRININLDISSFINLFSINHPNIHVYSQNDSQEFLRIFLNDINLELNECNGLITYEEIIYNLSDTKLEIYKKYNTVFNKREKSIITDLFYIGLINKFICTCNYETYSFENLLDLTLLLPTDINITNVKLDHLLNEYFKTTNSEFNTVCNYCKKICVHKKEIKINKLPDILIISI